MKAVFRLVSLVAALMLAMCPVSAQQYKLTALVSFDGTNGHQPHGGVMIDANGDIYGTTALGGAYGEGTAFRISGDTHELTTLVSFDGTNGSNPYGGLVADSSGNLFGTTSNGGAYDRGTVFELAANTYTLSTLVSNSTGATRASLMIDASGNLYGTTAQAGAKNAGTVFEIHAGTNDLTTLATFNRSDANGSDPRGALVMDSIGNLYGTNSDSPGAAARGTVFKIAADTLAITKLADFNRTNGAGPRHLIIDSDGNLYGTTESGHSGISGTPWFTTLYKVAAGTHAFSTLAVFPTTFESNSSGSTNPIMDASGNFYVGVAQVGPYGAIVKVDAQTHAVTTLAKFDGTNGNIPEGTIAFDALGNIYGTTVTGGEFGMGTVYRLSLIPEPSTRVLAGLGSLVLVGAGIRSSNRRNRSR